jgi:dihydroorotate dehydrogenase (NAD+) catalytic subunit
MNISVKLGNLKLKNPVITASGTFGYGEEYADFLDLSALGAIVVKGISLEPMPGNPAPRICETPCGMLNAIGLQNVGLKNFLKEKLPYLKKLKTKTIVNILGNTADEYVQLAEVLDDAGVDGIELNVSCPNVKKGGMAFAADEKVLGQLVSLVRRRTKRAALITKLSPNVSNIKVFARTAQNAGSDAISLINTIPAMAIDIETWKPKLAHVTGGLSGPAIKPIAVRMVWEAHQAVDVPLIGIGGIMNAEDAIEFMLAGATAVAVGTGNFVSPDATMNILQGIRSYLQKRNVFDIRELIGGLHGSQSHYHTHH